MRRACVVAGLAIALIGFAHPAHAAGKVLVIGLPEEEARRFLEGRPAAMGLGVYPDDRRPATFLEEVARGAPPGREGVRSPLGAEEGALRRVLEQAGRTVATDAGGGAAGSELIAPILAAPGAPLASAGLDDPRAASVLAVAFAASEDAVAFLEGGGWTRPIVLGIGERTPVLVAVLGEDGLLDGGVARRPGVVTPYDVAATILADAGVARPAGFIGRPLRVDPHPDAAAAAERLAARLERDASYGFAYTAAAVAVGIGALLLALALAAAGARDSALRLLQGAAMVPGGYLAGLFVQNGRAEVRALALVAAFFAGALVPPSRARTFCGAAFVASGAAIVALSVAAAARPGGEPALSLWGDPLVSWRFFGLRNHLVAFLTGGLVVGGGLLAWPAAAWGAAGAAVAVVAGASFLGANFVGVLTLVFGAALAVLWRWAGRVRLWHVPAAGAAAVGAFALALLADTGSPASHGGIAVRRIASGGLAAAADFVRVRVRLNYAEIRDFAGGLAWVPLLVLFLAACLVWATRRSDEDSALRAGVAGAAAAALAALALEDSGFFTAADLSLFPAVAVLLAWVGRSSALPGRGRGIEGASDGPNAHPES